MCTPEVLAMTAIRSLFKSLCVAIVLSAAAVSCLPISAKLWLGTKRKPLKRWMPRMVITAARTSQIEPFRHQSVAG